MLYVSGCLGLGADMKLVSGGASEEAKQALKNLGYILEAAGTSYENVIKTTLFLDDIGDFGQINEIYKGCEFSFLTYKRIGTYLVS